jgi:AMP phosphorylase
MKLKVKKLDIETGGTPIVVIDDNTAKDIDIHPMDRVKIKRGEKELIAVVDIARRAIGRNEIGVFGEVTRALKLREGQEVRVDLVEKPASVASIIKKLRGEELTRDEIYSIIKDTVENKLAEIELTAFVTSCYTEGMSLEEIYYLTLATVETGEKLELKRYPILDKHSIGGICGSRVSMIIVPIIASFELTIPKTSSRAITSPAGTADSMEVLARVSFTIDELKRIISKTHGCIAWGGAMQLAAADDKLIRVRYPLGLDPEGMLLSSILAKKLAVGATHVVLDIPVGEGAKVETMLEAKHLERQFLRLASRLEMNLRTVITDGSQPIGNGIGPALEARDVLLVLEGSGPKDLRDKSLRLAGELLELIGRARRGEGVKLAEKALESGKALRKMREIIAAQGGDAEVEPEDIKLGRCACDYHAEKGGKVLHIDNNLISKIARIAGAPRAKGAGIYLYKHVGDPVEIGEKILTVYSESRKRLGDAMKVLRELKPVEIG